MDVQPFGKEVKYARDILFAVKASFQKGVKLRRWQMVAYQKMFDDKIFRFDRMNNFPLMDVLTCGGHDDIFRYRRNALGL